MNKRTMGGPERPLSVVGTNLTPPGPASTAVTSLQNFVSQLRKLLGAETLETKPPGYRLHVEAGELDLERFRSLVEAGRAAPLDERGTYLRQALALWRGGALADFAFE